MRYVKTCLLLALFTPVVHALAQQAGSALCAREISITVQQQPLGQVLLAIAHKAEFYFSYDSHLIPADSLVSVTASHQSVSSILHQLLGERFTYHETGSFVILRPQVMAHERWYSLSGRITDSISGAPLAGVSVYETRQLTSVLTDAQGYFKLRLKEKGAAATIFISKDAYKDMLLPVASGYDQWLQLSIVPVPVNELAPILVSNRKVEKTWLGKFFLSSKQKMQSLNLHSFVTTKPVQLSLTPGLSTHNKMGAQVVNKASVNILGGYTAGVNGAEVAGLFNINRGDMRYVQLAGLFNVVGGHTEGFQAAGFSNTVLDSANGVQLAGGVNLVKGKVTGVQGVGYYNHIIGNMDGVQMAGGINQVRGAMRGVQVAGGINISRKSMNGVQVSGLLNYTHKLKGVQIGLINIADTSLGYSIGIINISKSGYHQLAVYSNELLDVNLAYKAGNKRMYSILMTGISIRHNQKAFGFGYGLGTGFSMGKKWLFNTEITAQELYLGNWKNVADIYRIQTGFQYRVSKNLAFSAGPSMTIYHNEQTKIEGYKSFPAKAYQGVTIGGNPYGWLGWQAGIVLF